VTGAGRCEVFKIFFNFQIFNLIEIVNASSAFAQPPREESREESTTIYYAGQFSLFTLLVVVPLLPIYTTPSVNLTTHNTVRAAFSEGGETP
jgi:hypothetical protein